MRPIGAAVLEPVRVGPGDLGLGGVPVQSRVGTVVVGQEVEVFGAEEAPIPAPIPMPLPSPAYPAQETATANNRLLALGLGALGGVVAFNLATGGLSALPLIGGAGAATGAGAAAGGISGRLGQPVRNNTRMSMGKTNEREPSLARIMGVLA